MEFQVAPLKRISIFNILRAFCDDAKFEDTKLTKEQLMNPYVPAFCNEIVITHIVDWYPSNLTDDFLCCLVKPSFTSLSIEKCKNVTVCGLGVALQRCPKLKSLNIAGCNQLVDPLLPTLLGERVPELTCLKFSDTKDLSDQVVQGILTECKALEELWLASCDSLTDKAFDYIATNNCYELSKQANFMGRRLNVIDLSGCNQLSSTIVRHISSLSGPNLRKANLSWTNIDCSALLYLAGYGLSYAVFLATSNEDKAIPFSNQELNEVQFHELQCMHGLCEDYGSIGMNSAELIPSEYSICTSAEQTRLYSFQQHSSNDCSNKTLYDTKFGNSCSLSVSVGGASTVTPTLTCKWSSLPNIDTVSANLSPIQSVGVKWDRCQMSEEGSITNKGEAPDGCPPMRSISFEENLHLRQAEMPLTDGICACTICFPIKAICNSERECCPDSCNCEIVSVCQSTVVDSSTNNHTCTPCDQWSLLQQVNMTVSHGGVNDDAEMQRLKMPAEKPEALEDRNEIAILNHERFHRSGATLGEESVYQCNKGYSSGVTVKNDVVDSSEIDIIICMQEEDRQSSVSRPSTETSVSQVCSDVNMDDESSKSSDKREKLQESLNTEVELTGSLCNAATQTNITSVNQHQQLDCQLLPNHIDKIIPDDTEGHRQETLMYVNDPELRENSSNFRLDNRAVKNVDLQTYQPIHFYNPNINEIDISEINFYNHDMAVSCLKMFIQANKTLTTLYISWKSLDDELLEFIAKHETNLRLISLVDCESLSNTGIQSLGKHCLNLTGVDLKGVSFITDQGLQTLIVKGCRLQSIGLAESAISDVTLRRIAHYCEKQLTHLDLSWCENITDSGLAHIISNCSNLRALDLRQCSASTKAFQALSKYAKCLESLGLCGVDSLTDRCTVAIIKNLPKLTDIDLSWNVSLTDDTIKTLLISCTELRNMALAGLKRLTSAPFLPMISGLEHWQRQRLKITEETLKDRSDILYGRDFALKEACHPDFFLPPRSYHYAPNLRRVDLSYCDKVNDTHLSEIIAVCRGSLHIDDYYGEPIRPRWSML